MSRWYWRQQSIPSVACESRIAGLRRSERKEKGERIAIANAFTFLSSRRLRRWQLNQRSDQFRRS